MTEQVRARAAVGEAAGIPFEIPGATGGRFRIEVLNENAEAGVVTSIVHLPPGGRIPAHRHGAGAEMHFVLDGDLIEAGEALGPGAFLTHAAGVVHGPQESRGGARVLTVQHWQSRGGSFDFEIVEEGGAAAAPVQGGGETAAAPRMERSDTTRTASATAPGAAEGHAPKAPDDSGGPVEAAEGVPVVGGDAAAQDRGLAEQSLGKGYG